MAKARNPITFGEEFGVTTSRLNRLGVLDVTLAIDTKLFIDPLLLASSSHTEIRKTAASQYKEHFEKIIRLLVASQRTGDAAWKAAARAMKFPEIEGTCLGYGAASIHGSGFGPKLSAKLITVAAEIVDIGIRDPDLFAAMALLESDIGPDRVSDMTTNIIIPALGEFNRRVLTTLKLKGTAFQYKGNTFTFMRNPYEAKRTPVILVPTDILRELPIAHDWDTVETAAHHNEELRNRVNSHIGEIWAKKSKRDKKRLKEQALSSKDAFETLLDALKQVSPSPYDSKEDPEGLIIWATKGQSYAHKHPLSLPKPVKLSLNELYKTTRKIIGQFRHLIEKCGLNKELYRLNGSPRHESTAQRLFFAVAYSYCKANNVDISPEIDTGTGKVDFKFSTGFDARVLAEIKLSTNQNLVTGYSNQIEDYKVSQETMKAIYLVIDVGKMGKKDQKLLDIRNSAKEDRQKLSDLEFVDGSTNTSPSKRK